MPQASQLVHRLLAVSCCLVIVAGMLGLVGHLFGVPRLYEWTSPATIGMSLPTACLFMLLGNICLGLLRLIDTR